MRGKSQMFAEIARIQRAGLDDRQQRVQMRGEREAFAISAVEQRLQAKAVAGQQQGLRGRIEQRYGVLAQHVGIQVGSPAPVRDGTQRGVVLVLADQPQGAAFAQQRLPVADEAAQQHLQSIAQQRGRLRLQRRLRRARHPAREAAHAPVVAITVMRPASGSFSTGSPSHSTQACIVSG